MIWLSQCDPKDQGCLQQSLEESSNMQDVGPCLLNSLNEKLYYKIEGPMRGMIVYGGRFRVIGKEGRLKYFIVHSMHMKILGGTQASFFHVLFLSKTLFLAHFLFLTWRKRSKYCYYLTWYVLWNMFSSWGSVGLLASVISWYRIFNTGKIITHDGSAALNRGFQWFF